MGRNELIFYYGYDLSSLTIQQRNLILNAYEEKLKYSNQPQLLPQSSSSSMRNYTDNFTKDFSEDSAIGIKRPDGIHCPLVELLESYENIGVDNNNNDNNNNNKDNKDNKDGNNDNKNKNENDDNDENDDNEDKKIKELLLQKKMFGNPFNHSFDLVKLNEIENEILKIREEKVKNLIRMNIMNIENVKDNTNKKRKRRLESDDDDDDIVKKKRKIENYSVSTTPTTPIDKFSLEFILNSSPQPVIANPINPKNIKNIKNKYIAPLGLYRDYSGINNPTPYLYFFRFSHFNQNYELDLNLMSQIEMLAKTKEDEILQFFNNLGIINLQQPRWFVGMYYS